MYLFMFISVHFALLQSGILDSKPSTSFIVSYVTNAIEMDGTTFSELGTKPLYNARKPSCLTIFLYVSTMPEYSSGALSLPSPVTIEAAFFHPTICSLLRRISKGYATVWPMIPATAPHASRVVTGNSESSTSPNGLVLINQSFNDSYTAKLRPTYGITPMKEGSQPL